MSTCHINTAIIHDLEPLMLIGEGQYNLNALTESKATNSFLGLTEEDRKCQNVEPLFNCTTRQYMDTLMQECGCIPFNIRLSDEVKKSN